METATKLSKGKVIIDVVGGDRKLLSETYACPECDFSLQLLNLECFHSMLLGAPVQNVRTWNKL